MLCLLVTVSTCGTPVVPTSTFPNEIAALLRTSGLVPVADSETVGVSDALLVTLRVPGRRPPCLGVVVTAMVQLADAASVVVHGEGMVPAGVAAALKSAIDVVKASDETGMLCLFVIVMICGALVVATSTLPNDTLVGLTVTGAVPMPVRAAV
jgi:hypothetical protein